MAIRVVTDSSAVVPRAWAESYPLEIIPLQLAWPDGTVLDGDPPYTGVKDRLAQRPSPTTSAPSPGAFGEILARLLLRPDDAVVVITPPTDLSTTFTSASLAAREVGEGRVRVVDARTAAAGQGIVAGEAARCAASPDAPGLDEVCDAALRAASQTEIWATLTQLEYLRRSGRVPAVAAIGAGALHLQPIVRYAGGKPTPVGVSRSARRASERILRAWERSVRTGGLRLLAFHCDRGDEAEAIVARVREHVPAAETYVVPVTASLAAHTGPGLLGLAWLWTN